jgi:hypothetical protein
MSAQSLRFAGPVPELNCRATRDNTGRQEWPWAQPIDKSAQPRLATSLAIGAKPTSRDRVSRFQ